jgi:hypothetical protein
METAQVGSFGYGDDVLPSVSELFGHSGTVVFIEE